MNIPKKMWAAVQHSKGSELHFEEVDVPQPGAGEVLVKMAYAPINPSDLSFLQGTYAIRPSYPVIPGIEGSGTVVAAGKGILPKMRMGKKVSCTSTKGHGGSWAEYMVTSAMHVIPVGNMEMEQAATMIVNPLTALSFIDIAKSGKHKAIINNAAGGALGRMISRLAQKEGIQCINIVRKKEQLRQLKADGALNVLNNTDEDYHDDFIDLNRRLKPTLILDPVGGPRAQSLLKHAPKGATLLFYANLSEQEICLNPRVLVQEEKALSGFYLADYAAKKNILKALSDSKKVQRLIKHELKTTIQSQMFLDELNEAIELYRNNMSAGKVLIQCKKK